MNCATLAQGCTLRAAQALERALELETAEPVQDVPQLAVSVGGSSTSAVDVSALVPCPSGGGQWTFDEMGPAAALDDLRRIFGPAVQAIARFAGGLASHEAVSIFKAIISVPGGCMLGQDPARIVADAVAGLPVDRAAVLAQQQCDLLACYLDLDALADDIAGEVGHALASALLDDHQSGQHERLGFEYSHRAEFADVDGRLNVAEGVAPSSAGLGGDNDSAAGAFSRLRAESPCPVDVDRANMHGGGGHVRVKIDQLEQRIDGGRSPATVPPPPRAVARTRGRKRP